MRTRRSRTTAGKPRRRPRSIQGFYSGRLLGWRRRSFCHGTHDAPRAVPKYRHHGPHRCRQDDDHRAHPLLHRAVLQNRRGPRRHCDNGLDGAGAGARNHDHLRSDHLLLGRPPHQHHRHAGPCRLHDRGRAQPACARRRGRRVRLSRRCRTAIGDRMAPSRQVRGPTDLLCQQDGSDRRGFSAVRRHDRRPTRRQAGGLAAAHRG